MSLAVSSGFEVPDASLFEGITYDYSVRPLDVHGVNPEEISRLNCESTVHVFLGHIGINIPPYLRAAELFYDDIYTHPVRFNPEDWASSLEASIGDIYLFGPSGPAARSRLHCAVVAEADRGEAPTLIHAYKKANGIVSMSLPEFATLDDIGDLQAIRRPNVA